MSSNLETNNIDTLVREMVFGSDSKDRQVQIRQMALEKNIFPASIQSLYEEIGKGNYSGFTVPAMNLRGITYEMARAAFRAALKHNVGALIFEIARSEMSYTLQTPGEYAGCVLAAAIAEGFEGPVFLQGDHIQIRRANYAKEPRKELDFARSLIKDLIEAGFYNIDIDASTLVDIDKADLVEQQKTNGFITAEMTRFIRLHQPANITISIGGEIGEIGSGNSTVEDLRAFMQVYNHDMAPGLKGISKIS
ncbi:MAG: class II fructose-bisphosphate aldolase, partial [Dehalococcoidales bacterium]|nr:class II fructose-bisphosphate aldolase [Dehalococcoidales bacterium]